jgi:hypothetical protein
MSSLSAQCLCGAVVVEGDLPTLFFAHCHCRWCRVAHGAAFVSWVGVRDSGFRVCVGLEHLRWYQSSARSRRGFCDHCGTTLLFCSTSSPGEMHIAAACVTTPIDRVPSAHVFVEQKVPWLTIGDDLKQVFGDHPNLAAYAGDPGRPS